MRITESALLGEQAIAFTLRAAGITEMPELAAIVNTAILPVGMTAAASGYVSGPRAASPAPFHFANWSPEWVRIYMAENFLLADPLPRWARSSGRPMAWTDLFDLLPPRDRGRRVIKIASHHKFTEGMAIPMRSADNHLGLVSFGGDRDRLSRAEQTYLTMIGRAAFENAERIERCGEVQKVPPLLSAREIELLVLLVRGHADQQISVMLGISLPTVRFHLNNAKEKLGAVSRTHLAALAVSSGYAPV